MKQFCGPALPSPGLALTTKSSTGSGQGKIPRATPRLREYFPETLLWQPEIHTVRAGHVAVKSALADSITIGTSQTFRSPLMPFASSRKLPKFIEVDPDVVTAARHWRLQQVAPQVGWMEKDCNGKYLEGSGLYFTAYVVEVLARDLQHRIPNDKAMEGERQEGLERAVQPRHALSVDAQGRIRRLVLNTSDRRRGRVP